LACIAAGLHIASSPAGAAEPSTYQEVLAAQWAGKTVEVLSDLSRCVEADSGKPGPPIRGGLRIGAFVVTDGRGIAFCDAHQTLNPAGLLLPLQVAGASIWRSGRYRRW
jgi:hypothetical protein